MRDEKVKSRDHTETELNELRRRVDELENALRLYKNVANTLPDIIFILDEDGTPLNIATGDDGLLLPEDSPQSGLGINRLIPDVIHTHFSEAIRQAINSGTTQIVEYSLDVRAGKKWFEAGVSPLPQREGRKREVVTVARDITERKRLQESLVISDAALKSVHECCYVVDTDFKIIYWNEMCEKTFGIRASEIMGKSIQGLYELVEEYPGQNEERRLILDTRGYNRAEERFRTAGGDIWMDVHIQRIEQDGRHYGWLTLAFDITARKQAEAQLRFSEATLTSIHEAVLAMDNDFFVTYWNPICEETFGIKAADAVGHYIGDLMQMVEEYPGQNRNRMNLLIKDGYNWEEQKYITPKGTLWVDVHAQAIEQDGIRYGWVTLINDITTRKNIEEELKISEERFFRAFRSVPDAIIISRLHDGLHLEVNDNFTSLTGYSREESIGKNAVDLGIWADLNTRAHVISLLERDGRVASYEHKIRRKSGEIRTCLVTMEPITISDEQCIISVLTDITDRIIAEERIRYQASLVDNVSDVIMSHDKDMRILSWNKAAEKIFSLKSEEVLGQDIRNLCRIEPIDISLDEVKATVKGQGRWRGEAIHYLKDGTVIVMRVSTMVVRENNNTPTYVMIMSDITEEKKAEEELKQHYENEKALRRELETEMKKRTEFAAAIVHELRTPLTAIISSSDLITESARKGILKRLALNINQSAKELDKRTGELLDMTSGEAGMLSITLESLDIADLVKEMSLELEVFLARKKTSLSLDVPETVPRVSADKARIRQVIYNLISNVYKYSGEGGTVTLKVIVKDSDVILEVRDTGKGMTKEEQAYIFEPYSQVTGRDRPVGGLGLGLAISKNLVSLHGGTIWVESKKGKGSSFFFSLPVDEN